MLSAKMDLNSNISLCGPSCPALEFGHSDQSHQHQSPLQGLVEDVVVVVCSLERMLSHSGCDRDHSFSYC